MRALSTRIHAILDYVLALLLLILPWGLAMGGSAAAWTPTLAGCALILYSSATDYEFGAVRRIQMPVHLWLDGILGVLLAISPWLFGFDKRVWAPHLVGGIILLALAIFSQTVPGYERRRG